MEKCRNAGGQVRGFLVLVLLGWLTPSCAQHGGDFNTMIEQLLRHSVPELTADSSFNAKTTYFLDARERAEYSTSHIGNALWVGSSDFNLSRVKSVSKQAPIVVYCSVGYRSEEVAEKLIKAGYTNVSNLRGGIFDWVNKGKAVYNQAGLSTDTVHTYNQSWSKWLTGGVGIH